MLKGAVTSLFQSIQAKMGTTAKGNEEKKMKGYNSTNN